MGEGLRGEGIGKLLIIKELRYKEVVRRQKFREKMVESSRLISQLSDLLNVLIELKPDYPKIFCETMEQRNMVANLTHLLRRIAVILDEETESDQKG